MYIIYKIPYVTHVTVFLKKIIFQIPFSQFSLLAGTNNFISQLFRETTYMMGVDHMD